MALAFLEEDDGDLAILLACWATGKKQGKKHKTLFVFFGGLVDLPNP